MELDGDWAQLRSDLQPGLEVVREGGLRLGEFWARVGDGEGSVPVLAVQTVAVEQVVVGAGVGEESLVAGQAGEDVLGAGVGILLEEGANVAL